MDCAYDSDYVYLLCANMSLDEYDNNPKSITIDVFDWFAKPIVKFEIAEPLNSLALDSEKNMLYGTTYLGQLFKYKLPSL